MYEKATKWIYEFHTLQDARFQVAHQVGRVFVFAAASTEAAHGVSSMICAGHHLSSLIILGLFKMIPVQAPVE